MCGDNVDNVAVKKLWHCMCQDLYVLQPVCVPLRKLPRTPVRCSQQLAALTGG
jgi:hypothetical protein